MKSQNDLILEHLKKGKTLTSLQALEKFGCFRLASRIVDLHKRGIDVKARTMVSNKKHYSQYYL